ncbi:MAG: V-type ATP synthase subunit E family protein [Acutalibacteraceae bacterium]|jgi:V/A-type H+-transporting ATPase subunit E
MTGLNKIIDKISQDSVAKCDGIIFDANNEATKIKNAAVAQGDAQKQEIIKEAKAKADAIIEMANSSASLEIRKNLLATKVEILNDTIDAAYEQMKAMPDKEYFAAIYALVKKYAQNMQGVMVLSQKDLDRKPKDFEKKINAQLPKDVSLEVSNKPANIGEGFILIYGDVEINCTFKAIIEDSRDELKDKIYDMIFA